MADNKYAPVSAATRPQFEERLREVLSHPTETTSHWDVPTKFVTKRDVIVYIGGQPGANDTPFDVVESLVEALVERGLARSARACDKDGVLACVARCCIEGSIGCFVLDDVEPTMDVVFGDATGGAVISVAPNAIEPLADQLDDIDVPYMALGQVGADRIIASGEPDNMTYVDLGLDEL